MDMVIGTRTMMMMTKIMMILMMTSTMIVTRMMMMMTRCKAWQEREAEQVLGQLLVLSQSYTGHYRHRHHHHHHYHHCPRITQNNLGKYVRPKTIFTFTAKSSRKPKMAKRHKMRKMTKRGWAWATYS